MIGLAIDSATASAALWAGSDQEPCRVLGWRGPDPDDHNRADQLIPTIDRLVRDQLDDYRPIGVIAVAHGPGGFTSIRCAVAAARALALALDRPVLPVTSLEVLATQATPQTDGTVVAALDARRGQVYVQAFDHRLAAHGPPREAPPDAALPDHLDPPIRLVGSGAALIQAAAGGAHALIDLVADPDARAVALRASALLAAGERPVAGSELRPFYLRAPDARPPAPPFARLRAVGA